MSEDKGQIEVESTDVKGQVLVRTDRPGERATSATVDGKELIKKVADALGITYSLYE